MTQRHTLTVLTSQFLPICLIGESVSLRARQFGGFSCRSWASAGCLCCSCCAHGSTTGSRSRRTCGSSGRCTTSPGQADSNTHLGERRSHQAAIPCSPLLSNFARLSSGHQMHAFFMLQLLRAVGTKCHHLAAPLSECSNAAACANSQPHALSWLWPCFIAHQEAQCDCPAPAGALPHRDPGHVAWPGSRHGQGELAPALLPSRSTRTPVRQGARLSTTVQWWR